MNNNIGNYAHHAQYWDWSGYDRSAEYEYWSHYAGQYGKNVLIPLCALGETGAAMAKRGFSVTAFDITPEMIAEGKKRFGDVPGLTLYEGDVTGFRFDIAPADFCFCLDFGHLLTIGDVRKALVCINNHLREGGGLVIETGLRLHGAKSGYIPPQTFYAEDETGKVESFDHAFYLQKYFREEWLAALKECGFDVRYEYRNRQKEPWREGDEWIIIEAAKKRTFPLRDSEVMYLLREYRGDPCASRIEWLTADDTAKINNHLIFCGKKPGADDWLSRIYESGSAKYCLFYVDGNPVGRGAIEPYSENMWEAADIYVAKEYRNRGLAKEILRALCAEILSHGKIVSCRTERDNHAMRKAIKAIGFYPDGGNEHEQF